jgi:hypothetical protein
LGTYGNHAIHLAAIERIFIPAIKPKFAITIFYANDNEDDFNSIYLSQYFKKNTDYFEYEHGKLSLNKSIVDFYEKAAYLIEHILSGNNSPDDFINQYSKISYLEKSIKYLTLPKIRNVVDNYLKVNNLKTKLPMSSQLAIDTLSSECKEVGCTPVVMYIPNSKFWRPDPRASHYLRLLKDYCRTNGIKFIDSSQRIDAIGEDAYAPKGPHLSPLGYRTLSTLILETIQQID